MYSIDHVMMSRFWCERYLQRNLCLAQACHIFSPPTTPGVTRLPAATARYWVPVFRWSLVTLSSALRNGIPSHKAWKLWTVVFFLLMLFFFLGEDWKLHQMNRRHITSAMFLLKLSVLGGEEKNLRFERLNKNCSVLHVGRFERLLTRWPV